MSRTHPRAARHGVLTITIAVIVSSCGGDDDAASTVDSIAPVATTPASGTGATDSGGGTNPFAAVVSCLQQQGLDVQEPDFGGAGGGGFPAGSTPPGGSFPGGSLPGGSIPEGGFPGGSFPGGGFSDGSIPPDFSVPDGSRPPRGGGQVPSTMIATVLGLDATDPDVASAIAACSDQLG